MKRYALFLGCTTPVKVPQYELASRWVCNRLGIELVDIEEFGCCGSNQRNLSVGTALIMAAMNLALAEERGLEVLTLCAACTGSLAEAAETLRDDSARERVNEKLKDVGLAYRGTTVVKHLSRVLYEDVGVERIMSEAKEPLAGVRVAPHYGCHYLRPRSAFAGFDEPDNPRTLHRLIAATGAEPVDYRTAGLCCGGKVSPVSADLSRQLVRKKIEDLAGEAVRAMVLQCQTCYLMYNGQMPVLLYPQLLGLALGARPAEDLGMEDGARAFLRA